MKNKLLLLLQKVRAVFTKPAKEQWSRQLYEVRTNNLYDAKIDGNKYNLSKRR